MAERLSPANEPEGRVEGLAVSYQPQLSAKQGSCISSSVPTFPQLHHCLVSSFSHRSFVTKQCRSPRPVPFCDQMCDNRRTNSLTISNPERQERMTEPAVAKRFFLSVDLTGKTPVVHCRGKLVAGDTERFYNDLKELMSMYKEIVVDFQEVPHLDSSGLGTLARLYVHAKSVGCVIEIV